MTCIRCRGYLIPERFGDLMDSAEPAEVAGWRCINCGDMVDGVILKHRSGAVTPYRSQRRWSSERRKAWPAEDSKPAERGGNIVVA